MEVEEIILNKEYFELNETERNLVQELAKNEQEYNDLKWFLTSTKTVAANEKITASEDLKKSVFAELNNPANKRIWLNSGAGATVAKPKKKIYQMPAFQVAIAACIVVGFFLIANPFGEDDTQLALNDTTVSETVIEEAGLDSVKFNAENMEVNEQLDVSPLEDLPKDILTKSQEENQFYRDGDLKQKDLFSGTTNKETSGERNNLTGGNAIEDQRNEDINQLNTEEVNTISTFSDMGVEDGSLGTGAGNTSTDFAYEIAVSEELEEMDEVADEKMTVTGSNNVTNAPVMQDLEFSADEDVVLDDAVDIDKADEPAGAVTTIAGIGNMKKMKNNREASEGNKDVGGRTTLSIAESPELTNLFFTVP